MQRSGVNDIGNTNPFQLDEIYSLIEQLGESIIDEVLFKVNQELGRLNRRNQPDPAQILGRSIPEPQKTYTLQDPGREEDSIPKTLLQVTELLKNSDSTTNVEEVFGPSPWLQTHDSERGLFERKESSTARMIFQAPEEPIQPDESNELFLLKELLNRRNKPIVFEPAPKRKKTESPPEPEEEPKPVRKRFSSPSEFDLDPVKLIRMKPGGSVNG